jgi:hypothetical protein
MAHEQKLEIKISEEIEGGVYANGAGVWHTPHEFTLDFFSTQPPAQTDPAVLPARVVARVKIPPTVIFELMRALNVNMTSYENTFGPIRRLETGEIDEEPEQPEDLDET